MNVIEYGNDWFRLKSEGDDYLYLRKPYDLDNPVAVIQISESAQSMLSRLKLPFSHLAKDYLSTPTRLKEREISGDVRDTARKAVMEYTATADYIGKLSIESCKLPDNGSPDWVDNSILSHDGKKIYEIIFNGTLNDRCYDKIHPHTDYWRLVINEHYFPGNLLSSNVSLSVDSRYLLARWLEKDRNVIVDCVGYKYLFRQGGNVDELFIRAIRDPKILSGRGDECEESWLPF